MSCNSAIYTVNNQNTVITTTAGTYAQIPFGSVNRRFGKRLQLDGASMVAFGSGYFDVSASLTVAPTEAGEVTAQLFQNGLAVPGASASATAAAAGDQVTLPILALVRNCGCDCNSTLSVCVNASCTVVNFAVVIKKD